MKGELNKEIVALQSVEPSIYSVLPDDESGNEYDTRFGFIYDLIACNPIYNRFIWGYYVRLFPKLAEDALWSPFTVKAYCQFTERVVVLTDQSLKMLRMAKARLIKENGEVPEKCISQPWFKAIA